MNFIISLIPLQIFPAIQYIVNDYHKYIFVFGLAIHSLAYVHVYINFTCISGPAVAMVAMVSEPMASTIFLNLPVSISDSSRDLTISSSFCSLMYFNSASRALVRRSSSDSYEINNWKLLQDHKTYQKLTASILDA